MLQKTASKHTERAALFTQLLDFAVILQALLAKPAQYCGASIYQCFRPAEVFAGLADTD